MTGILFLINILINTWEFPVSGGQLESSFRRVVTTNVRLAITIWHCGLIQWELFLPEVNNKETIAAIEANNDTYYLQKRIEKFPL